MIKIKKKLFTILLITFLVLSIFPFSFMPVQGHIGAVGTTFTINSPDAGSAAGEYHDGSTSNHMFHVGNYWYKMGCEYNVGVAVYRWFWLSTIDTNLSDWSDASAKNYFSKNSYGGAMWAQYQSVYDTEQELFHSVWTNQDNGNVLYIQGTPNATGGVTLAGQKTLITTVYNGNLDICLMGGKPVVVVSGPVDGQATWVLFSSDEDGTSWTNTYADTKGELNFDYVFPQVHAINSTFVYVIVQNATGIDGPLYGFYANTGLNATTSFTQITTDSVEGTSFNDGNNKVVSGYSTVSVNTVTPTSYTELISVLYINTTMHVKMLFWNVTTDSISGDAEVIYSHSGIYFPIQPLSAMESNIIWAGFWNCTAVDANTFVLYERNPSTETWGDLTEVDTGVWGATEYNPSCMNKQPYDGILIVTQQASATIYGCDVETVGTVWNSDVTISNMEGCGNWIIAEHDFYSFEAQYGHGDASGDAATYIDTAKIAFTDSVNWMNATYDAQEGEFSVEAGTEIFALKSGGITESGLYLNVTFEIYLYGEVIDMLNVDIYMYVNDTAGNEDTWEIQAEDYFNIYNLGGYPVWTTDDYGGRTTGGEAFELWAGQAGYTDVWSEDFEDGDLVGWGTFEPGNETEEDLNYVRNQDEASVQVPPIIDYSHDRSMKIYDASANFTSAWHEFLSQSEEFYVQFYLDTPTDTEDISIIITNMSEGGSGGIWIQFLGDGYAYFNNSTGKFKIKDAKYSGSSYWWRNMTLDINITSQTYDIWWNEVLQENATGVTFNNTRTTLDLLMLTTYVDDTPAEHCKVYFDEIRVWRPELGGAVGGWSQVTVHYWKLQHLHSLFAIGLPNAVEGLGHEDEGFIEWGIDYCIDDTWINNAWKVKISVRKADIQYTSFGTSGQNWIRLKVDWYERNTTLIDTEYFYTFWEGGPGGLAATEGQSDFFRLYLDLWFNSINASSTIGGRVSSYYYGMSDRSHPWFQWLTGSNWKILGGERAQSMYFADLEDASGVIHSAKEIEMMRIRAKVWRSENYDYMWRMEEFDLLSYRIAPDLMTGVNTPIFVETRIPSMPSGGLLEALSVAFSNLIKTLSRALGPGLLAFWDVLVDFLDNVFTFFGWNNGFSQIVSWISDFLGFLTTSASTLVIILTSIFEIVTGPLVDFLTITASLITNTISSISGMITQIGLAYNDTVLPLTPMIVPIITLIGVMIPMWELIRMEQKGFAILFQDLNLIFDLFSFFISIFEKVIQLVIRFVSFLIESIPVIE